MYYFFLIQVRINLKISLEKAIMNHISLGRINMLQRTLIVVLEIFQNNIFQRKKLNNQNMNPIINSVCQNHSASILVCKVLVEKLLPLCKRKKTLRLQFPNPAPLKKERFQSQSLEDITIEAIFQSELIIKVQLPN